MMSEPLIDMIEVGLLINFGSKSLQYKRLANKKMNQQNQGNPEIKIISGSDNGGSL